MQHSFENNRSSDHSAPLTPLSVKASLPKQDQELLSKLERSIIKSEWKTTEKLLGTLLRHGDESLRAIFVNSEIKDGLSPLATLVSRGAPQKLVEGVLAAGASPDDPVTSGVLAGSTPLHLAVLKEREVMVRLLVAKGAEVDIVNSAGKTPLAIAFYVERGSAEKPICRALLALGAQLARVDDLTEVNLRGMVIKQDLTGLDLTGANLIDADLSDSVSAGTRLDGAWFSEKTKLPRGIHPSFYDMTPAKKVFLKGEWQRASNKELEKIFLQQPLQGPKSLAGAPWQEARRLVEAGGSYIDGIHYCEVFRDAVARAGTGPGTALNILLPRLLFTYDLPQIRELLRNIENKMEWNDEPLKYHQNEAELLALCNHPMDPEASLSKTGLVTLAITSIDVWMKSNALPKLPRSTVEAWGGMGLLTFSFLNWKFDAQRIYSTNKGRKEVEERSLLEKFGLVSADEAYPQIGRNKDFGPSFLLLPGSRSFDYLTARGVGEQKTFSEGTFIEFRRGYLLISHPDHGTLLIRNSSPEFGRDLLQHPAYYSPKGIGDKSMSIEDLLSFTPEKSIKKFDFVSVLEPELHTPTSKAPSHMAFLVAEGIGLKDSYRAWKFDTKRESAWEIHPELEEPYLVGGYLSPGFREMVTFLEKRLTGKGEIPELAVAPSYYPAWVPYSYLSSEGIEKRRLPVDEETIELLKGLIEGDVDEERLQESDVYTFLQLAFSTQGELILMSPEEH